jgi:hypothetical protein
MQGGKREKKRKERKKAHTVDRVLRADETVSASGEEEGRAGNGDRSAHPGYLNFVSSRSNVYSHSLIPFCVSIFFFVTHTSHLQ